MPFFALANWNWGGRLHPLYYNLSRQSYVWVPMTVEIVPMTVEMGPMK